MKLFEGQEQPKLKLKINKQFADKYQKKKERELLDKKGQMLEELDDSDSSVEDENGQLINEHITSKFIQTLAKIRYKHPDIYKSDQNIFEEEDFEAGKKQKKNKKMTYADIQNDIDPEQAEQFEEYEPNVGITPEEEQKALKNAFKQAASTSKQNELLKMKHKSEREIEDENQKFNRFLQNHQPEEQDILQRYWGNEEELDEKDKFLRKYIMTQGWIDKDEQSDFNDSSQDEEKMDKFEEEYNFRFEEPGGNQLVTFERDQPNTMRAEKENARKRQKLAKAEREKDLKKQLEKELVQLKQAKKNELIDKIQKIQQVGDIGNSKLILKEMQENEFKPDEYDQQMEELYNDDYFEQENEENSNELDIEQEQDSSQQEQKEPKEQDQQDIDNVIKIQPNIPIMMKKNLNQDEIQALKSQEMTIWWYCDNCKLGINPGQFRWDCQVCDDYTLCEQCNQIHQHKLKKQLVPAQCIPPNPEQLAEILKQFKYCRACSIKMTDENDYYQSKKDYLCIDCWEKDKNQKRYTLIESEIQNIDQLLEADPEGLKSKLPYDAKKLVDEYYDLEFEDVIAGGIKTKFQYIEVEKDSFGLTNDDLLYADDKLLNQYVSIKKLAPYREGQITIKRSKADKLIELIRKSTKKNKKLILNGQNPKDYQKKKQENQFELEIEDNVANNTYNVDSKRLKAYGV